MAKEDGGGAPGLQPCSPVSKSGHSSCVTSDCSVCAAFFAHLVPREPDPTHVRKKRRRAVCSCTCGCRRRPAELVYCKGPCGMAVGPGCCLFEEYKTSYVMRTEPVFHALAYRTGLCHRCRATNVVVVEPDVRCDTSASSTTTGIAPVQPQCQTTGDDM